MSGYLLDTSLVAAFLRGRPGAVTLISPWIAGGEVATSIIVYGEAFEYVSGFSNPGQWQAALRALPVTMSVFDLTYAIMERYAALRRAMRPPRHASAAWSWPDRRHGYPDRGDSNRA